MASVDPAAISEFGIDQFEQLSTIAVDALQQLKNAALGIAFSTVNYVGVDIHSPATLPSIDISSLPSIASLTQAFSQIQAGNFPPTPDMGSVDKYRNYMWQGANLATITSAINSYLVSLGMPATSYQDAIFDADKERKLRVMSDSIDLVQAKTSASGFKYANSQTNAGILDIVEKYQFDQENQSRTITQQMTEWARQAYQFSIQQGLSVETAQMDFSLKFGGLFLDYFVKTFTAILEKFRAYIQIEVEKLRATVELIIAEAKILEINSNVTVEQEKLFFQKDTLAIEQAKIQFDGNITQQANNAKEQIEAGQATAQTAGEIMKGIGVSTINLVNSTGS